MRPDPRTAPLGHAFDAESLALDCPVVFGGVAWPAKAPGCAVVVGRERRMEEGGDREMYLLDECESADIGALVRWCGGAHFRYRPRRWMGDTGNKAAARLIAEFNREKRPADDKEWRPLSLCPTFLADIPEFHSYALPQIKRLLDPERRYLYLKDSRILGYLGTVKPDEVPFLVVGEFPSVEALAFAVLELRQYEENPGARTEHQRLCALYGRPGAAG